MPASLKLLAPYYLQRLHEIAPVPARVLVALARGAPAMTVTDLAAEVATSKPTRIAGTGTTVVGRMGDPHQAVGGRRAMYSSMADSAVREFVRDRLK